MRKTPLGYALPALCALCALFTFGILSGCASTAAPPAETAAPAETATPAETPAQAAETAPQESAADLETLLTPVLRQFYFSMCVDYFMQFVYDEDYIFPETLMQIFSLPAGPYQVGEQTRLVFRSPDGAVTESLQVALLAEEEDGSRWWQVDQQGPEDAVFYEVRVSREGVPLVLRYLNPEDGLFYQSVPLVAVEFERALEQMPRDELAAKIREAGEEERRRWWDQLFRDPRVLGEESLTVGAGTFRAVHVLDVHQGEQGAEVHFWLSPQVPGGIVKISSVMAGEPGEYSAELVALNRDVAPAITEEMALVRSDMSGGLNSSEGSPEEPVLLLPGGYHRGSVAAEGTSFYRIDVERRADISVEVSDLAGDAELFYYAGDDSYTDWVSASSGSTLDLQEYYAEPGMSLYFSIADYADDAGAGESYSIQVLEDPVLSSTGVMMRGDIYTRAVEMGSGGRYRKSLGRDALAYYQTTVKNGPNLRIEAENLPGGAALVWFDTLEGSYDSGFTETSGESAVITVRGLAPGTVCLYYVVGEPETAGGKSFNLTVSEFQD